MKSLRLALSAVLMILSIVAFAQSQDTQAGMSQPAAPTCGPGTCQGCCDGDICRIGDTTDACGSFGGPCFQCLVGQVCAPNIRCDPGLFCLDPQCACGSPICP
jgi:hypothetical protein